MNRRFWASFGSVLAVGLALYAFEAGAFQPGKAAPSPTDANPAVRAAALRAIGCDGDPDLFIKALRDEDPDIRLIAADYLGCGERQGERRAAALVQALRDPHMGVHCQAADSLNWMGPESGAAVIQALTDADPRVRAGAAYALGYGGGGNPKLERRLSPADAERAIPLLEKLLDDENTEVRENAAEALKHLRREIEK